MTHTHTHPHTHTHTHHLSFGSDAESHPSSIQPAASCALPNHHCTMATTDGLTSHTHTHTHNQEWWCTTNHSECVPSLRLPSPPSITLISQVVMVSYSFLLPCFILSLSLSPPYILSFPPVMSLSFLSPSLFFHLFQFPQVGRGEI